MSQKCFKFSEPLGWREYPSPLQKSPNTSSCSLVFNMDALHLLKFYGGEVGKKELVISLSRGVGTPFIIRLIYLQKRNPSQHAAFALNLVYVALSLNAVIDLTACLLTVLWTVPTERG